jgi:hypothetical protein
MTIQYDFVVESLICLPLVDNNANVVTSVNWRLGATDGEKRAIYYGQTSLSLPDNNSFVDYALLSKNDVYQWVLSSFGENKFNELKTNLSNQIQASSIVQEKELPLPWI